MFKKLIINGVLPFWYKMCCIRRVREKALFVEIREKNISTNFTGIIAYLKRNNEASDNKMELDTHFLKLGGCSRMAYIRHCMSLMPKLATAKYVFINESSNMLAALKLRKGTKLIQTWHGCGALKKFGYSTGTTEAYYGNEDIVTVSSDDVVDYYSEAMGLPREKVCPIGVPRTDVFYQDAYREKCALLREKLLAGRNKKIILFAPTFRGNVTDAQDSQGLNLDLMYKNLGQEYIVISKLHSALRPVKRQYRRKDFYYDVSDKWTIEEAMGVCDILITDYSSLIFEYSLLGKPAIFYAYDLEEYTKDRGFFIDYRVEMPGAICTSTIEIIKEIKNGCYDVAKMTHFRNKYMRKCDGHVTQRLIGLVMGE